MVRRVLSILFVSLMFLAPGCEQRTPERERDDDFRPPRELPEQPPPPMPPRLPDLPDQPDQPDQPGNEEPSRPGEPEPS